MLGSFGVHRHWLLPAVLLSVLGGGLGCRQADPEQVNDRENRPARPNVLLIVVDTLRADHLQAYGYQRQTSPQIKSRLADRGVVVERAYSQAPWTLPSMASMMSGLDPARLLDDNGNPWGLPDTVSTLAEELQSRGYSTHGFVANPTLHEGNGFGQGFDTFETAPYDVASLRLHADSLDAKIQPTLSTLEEPFFLYAHYLDPHDPYENPQIPNGISPFFPEYQGDIKGTDVHGLYLQKKQMSHPRQDVEHLRALYDSEIHYVDDYVGRLLDGLSSEVLGRTLVVLTSDHGEELYDHGGWKHGESVYEEQIRVPMIWRWDGELPAGERLDATVQLLDLMPTLLEATAAAEDPPAPDGDGRSLWQALTAQVPLSPAPAYSRHHAEGPVRAARIDGTQKEILFDRQALFTPGSERAETFWHLDRERMARHEAYDLGLDPRELNPTEKGNAGGVLALLDRTLKGIRFFVNAGSEPAARWSGQVRFSRPPSGVQRWFLAADDQVELEGSTLRFELTTESLVKGFTVLGSVGEIVDFSWSSSDPTAHVEWGADSSPTNPPVGLRRLLVEEWPMATAEGSRLHIWLRPPSKSFVGERDEETLRRLKALGYAD